MLVVHGLWAYGASYLWAEDSALPAAAPARPGGCPVRPGRIRSPCRRRAWRARSPGCPNRPPGLAGQAVEDELTLRLPSGTDGPLASPELIRPPGQDGAGASRPAGRRVSLAPWRVPALAFEPAPAVNLLTVLGEPGALSGEVIGGSARYLAAVARLGADLAARGRVLPALRAEDGGHAARWRPVLSGADAERARELAAGMPAMCRAADAGDGSSALILTAALDALTDAAARARLAGQPLLPARRGHRSARIPVAERWIVALTSAGGQVEVTTTEDEQEAAELAARLDAWHSAAQLPAGPVRTCFRLIEPELEEGAGLGAAKNSADASGSGGTPAEVPGDWRVEFALQSTDDPSLVLPAPTSGRALPRLAWPPGSITQRRSCSPSWAGPPALSRAGRALRTAAPAAVSLDTEEAHRFLRRGRAAAVRRRVRRAAAGLVRAALGCGSAPAQARGRRPGSIADRSPKFGLGDLVDFR